MHWTKYIITYENVYRVFWREVIVLGDSVKVMVELCNEICRKGTMEVFKKISSLYCINLEFLVFVKKFSKKLSYPRICLNLWQHYVLNFNVSQELVYTFCGFLFRRIISFVDVLKLEIEKFCRGQVEWTIQLLIKMPFLYDWLLACTVIKKNNLVDTVIWTQVTHHT
jgi:hypothetical protein